MNAFEEDELEFLYPEPFVIRAFQEAIAYREQRKEAINMLIATQAALHAEKAAHASTRRRLREALANRGTR